MKRLHPSHHSGFTLVELLISGTIASAVAVAVFAFMNAGMFLTAKNLSLNFTSNQMRGALDRVESVLQQGDTNPVLLDATGATVASGPAAGVRLDRYVGGPFVVTASTTTQGSTSILITRSTNALASPPIPTLGDVLRLDGAAESVRPRLTAAPLTSAIANSRENITCTITPALAATVIPPTSSVLTAKTVRQVAFIVMSNGAKKELRYYPTFETTGNLNDSTKYTVITDQLATQPADATPFSISTVSGEQFINFSLRVRASNYDNRLRNKQSDEYNTFTRVESFLRPKVNPPS